MVHRHTHFHRRDMFEENPGSLGMLFGSPFAPRLIGPVGFSDMCDIMFNEPPHWLAYEADADVSPKVGGRWSAEQCIRVLGEWNEAAYRLRQAYPNQVEEDDGVYAFAMNGWQPVAISSVDETGITGRPKMNAIESYAEVDGMLRPEYVVHDFLSEESLHLRDAIKLGGWARKKSGRGGPSGRKRPPFRPFGPGEREAAEEHLRVIQYIEAQLNAASGNGIQRVREAIERQMSRRYREGKRASRERRQRDAEQAEGERWAGVEPTWTDVDEFTHALQRELDFALDDFPRKAFGAKTSMGECVIFWPDKRNRFVQLKRIQRPLASERMVPAEAARRLRALMYELHE